MLGEPLSMRTIGKGEICPNPFPPLLPTSLTYFLESHCNE